MRAVANNVKSRTGAGHGCLCRLYRGTKESWRMVGSNRLQPSAARPTFGSQRQAEVLDGPFADSKEQLAGYYLIDVADLAAAKSWASKCPAAGHGAVEVRAVWAITRRVPNRGKEESDVEKQRSLSPSISYSRAFHSGACDNTGSRRWQITARQMRKEIQWQQL